MPEIPLELIDEWEHNNDLRMTKQESVDEIDRSLRLGQIASFLVTPKADGRFTSLGGNNRLKRMHVLNYSAAECEILEFEQDDQGFYPVINGKTYKEADGTIPVHFDTVLEGQIALAFLHNNRYAMYRKDGVANMVGNFPKLNWKGMNADFKEAINIGNLKQGFELAKDKMTPKPKNATCPSCGHEFELKD